MLFFRSLGCILMISLYPYFGYGQEAQAVSLDELTKLIQSPSTDVKVFNFWATWCRPCIEELPQFEQAHQDGSAKIWLVSLDYDLDPAIKKVNRFITRHHVTAQVLFLTENNPNKWINSIEKKWTGAIPATLMINPTTGKRNFIEGMLSEGELQKILSTMK